jgi:ribonuclease G
MTKQLIINCTPPETRVALIENGQLAEFYIERARERGIVGSIFKGRITRVLPGMQSAFLDIGLDRAAFLFGGDIFTESSPSIPEAFLEDDEDRRQDKKEDRYVPKQSKHMKISDLVSEGQEILVQVAKDSIGSKGARVTTFLSFPGRYVVLMPNIKYVGISRRIGSEEERNRLRQLVNQVKPDNVGIIVRTASENVPDEKIKADIEFLVKLWESIKLKSLKSPAPSLIHEDLNLVFRATRDLMNKEFERIIIDNLEKYEDLVRFLNRFSVKMGAQVQLFQSEVNIFDAFGIEVEINRALKSKVWLKSGGYLVIEQTEALTAIDVNTGRFVGSRSLEDTIVKTNLEAVKEIVLQLRLRNIGGIIILDFIDMERNDDRERVFHLLQEELKKDKAKTTALRISEMGLVQMTRKRTEVSLLQKLCTPCEVCEGKGLVKSVATVAYEVLRSVYREIKTHPQDDFVIKVNPSVADRLEEEDREFLDQIRKSAQKKLVIQSQATFHQQQFEFEPI